MPYITCQPIINYVDNLIGAPSNDPLDGLRNLPGITGLLESVEVDDPRGGCRVEETFVQTLAERRETKRVQRLLARMRTQGRVQLDTADDFCIEVLGVHPFEVYGMAWFDLIDDAVAAMADEDVAA